MPAFRSRSLRDSTSRPHRADRPPLRVDRLECRDVPSAFSTYIGGSANDFGVRTAVDAAGNIFVLGGTFSTDLPTTIGTPNGDQDIYLAKLAPTGQLLWSALYGGNDHDGACDLALDAAGNVYISAQTESTNFPTTPGAYQTTYSGTADVSIILKVNGTSGAIIHATYLRGLSGNAFATAFGIAVDAVGSVYLTGGTLATDFPTTAGAIQTVFGGSQDVFVTKMTPDLSALVYSTYLGGVGLDQGWEISVDAAGNAYVAGNTGASNDFPTTPGALRMTNTTGHRQAFAAKLDSGGALVYSTYLGGTLDTEGYGLAVDAAGSAYVTGYTKATDFPVTAGAAQGTFGGGIQDAYVLKLSPSGGSLDYATYLGGAGTERGWAVVVDAAGRASLTGETGSTNFPLTVGAAQGTYGGGTTDAFVTQLNPAGSAVTYSSYLGGSGQDTGRGLTIDSAGNAYPIGGTSSTNFPTTAGAIQGTYGGGFFDMFVTGTDIVTTNGPAVTIDQAAGQADPTGASSITFDVVFAAPVTGFTGSDIDFTGSTVGGTLSASVSGSGSTYTVTVTGMTGQGTVVASIPAGAADDLLGNPSLASTSTDNQVTFDGIAPTVTINQQAGQPDPTNAGPIAFDVTFSEPVTGFDGSDIDFTGSTVGGTPSAQVSGSGASYTVTVTGMTGEGTVMASVPAAAATDSVGNPNTASTSTDNVVAFDALAPTVTINQGAGQADPTGDPTVAFDVTFSEPVTGFGPTDIDLSASTAGGTLTAQVTPTGPTTFAVTVTGMTSGGTVVASVPAGAAADGLGNPSAASTSTDNSVAFRLAGILGFTTTAVATAEGDPEFDLVVSRTGGSDGTVTVNVAAVIGSAGQAVDPDYTVAAGTLTWTDGDTTDKLVRVRIENDEANEGRETFTVVLSSPTGGAGLGADTVAITIAPSDGLEIDGAAVRPNKPFAVFTDSDGDLMTVKLGGRVGTATVYRTDPDGGGTGPIEWIDLAGTSPVKSTLTITVKKPKGGSGDGRTTLAELSGTGLRALTAATTDLIGTGIHPTEWLGSLKVGNISGGADLTLIGAPPTGLRNPSVKVTAGVIEDGTNITVAGAPLGRLTAIAYGDGTIAAPAVGSIVITGKAKTRTAPAIAGDFHADVTVSGAGVPAGKNAVGSLRVRGAVSNSAIEVGGNVGSVRVATFVNSSLLLGTGGIMTADLKLGSFTAAGLTGVVQPAFADSTITADRIGTVTLKSVGTADPDQPFGVTAGTSLGAVRVTTPVFRYDAATPLPQGLSLDLDADLEFVVRVG